MYICVYLWKQLFMWYCYIVIYILYKLKLPFFFCLTLINFFVYFLSIVINIAAGNWEFFVIIILRHLNNGCNFNNFTLLVLVIIKKKVLPTVLQSTYSH